MQGAANVSLSKEKIANLSIPIPTTINEQQELIDDMEQIASKITTLEAQLIELRRDLAGEQGFFRESLA